MADIKQKDTKFKKGQHASPNTEFKKGNPSPRGMLGKHHSKTAKIAIGKGQIGNKHNLGKHHTDDWKQRMSECHKGEKNGRWEGGISDNPYPKEFDSELKLRIRQRDSFTCCLCGRTEREELEELNRVLCVNHIDFNKDNCREENLNTLCSRCNTKINREREYWENYFKIIE